jgi:rubrerythrin
MGQTGTPDPIYDLISVAYHALQGAETYEQYARDAQQQGDQEAADYFRRTQQQCKQSADEAQQLLASRLHQGVRAQAGARVP